jgi:hypothetical protein
MLGDHKAGNVFGGCSRRFLRQRPVHRRRDQVGILRDAHPAARSASILAVASPRPRKMKAPA